MAATLQAGDLHLVGDPPFLKLRATNEKSRRGSVIPLRRDLAEAIRAHLAEKHGLSGPESPAIVKFGPQKPMKPAKRDTSDARAPGGQSCHEVTGVPDVPADAPLFDVPSGLIRIFDRDLAVAGIPKRTETGLTVDVHSLRHTAATWLSQARVSPKVAQELMRHGSLAMTLGVYTHAGLRDTAEAVELLPVIGDDGMGPLTAPGEVAGGD